MVIFFDLCLSIDKLKIFLLLLDYLLTIFFMFNKPYI